MLIGRYAASAILCIRDAEISAVGLKELSLSIPSQVYDGVANTLLSKMDGITEASTSFVNADPGLGLAVNASRCDVDSKLADRCHHESERAA